MRQRSEGQWPKKVQSDPCTAAGPIGSPTVGALVQNRRSSSRQSRRWHSCTPQLREGCLLLFSVTALPTPQLFLYAKVVDIVVDTARHPSYGSILTYAAFLLFEIHALESALWTVLGRARPSSSLRMLVEQADSLCEGRRSTCQVKSE